jgi:hypothetical protein
MEPPREPAEAVDWEAIRQRYSRQARIYDRFETHATAGAAYQAPELRARRVAQVARWKAMTAPERQALLQAEAAEAERWEDFLVSLYTDADQDNDLGSRRTAWRIALVVPGEGEALPVEIRRERMDAQLRELYPFVGDFDVAYRVRFARWKGAPLAGRRFLLRIAGPKGRLDFDFAEEVRASP